MEWGKIIYSYQWSRSITHERVLGLAYFSEVPVVLVDVQRAGPSTGMPTRTQQSDVLEAAYASHGDTKHVLLFPSTPQSVFLYVGSF